jgi:hypothetical protein
MADLDHLGVGRLIDLRRPAEPKSELHRWPSAGVAVLTQHAGLATPPPHLAAASLEHDAKAVLDLDDGRLAKLRARLIGSGAFKINV